MQMCMLNELGLNELASSNSNFQREGNLDLVCLSLEGPLCLNSVAVKF